MFLLPVKTLDPNDINTFIHLLNLILGASLVAQMVKNLPTMQETQVQSLGWEVSLEKRMAIYSSILIWRIPWTKSLVGYSPYVHRKSDM